MAEEKGNSPATILDIACEFFGSEPDSDLYAAVTSAPAARLEAFLEHYRAIGAKGRLQAPVLEAGSLRPYLPTDNLKIGAWLHGSFYLDQRTFYETEKVWHAVDQIKHRLLYCHSVAVDNPLGFILLSAADGETFRFPDAGRWRARLGNFVSFLLHMKPLIERHVLCFVSPAIYLPGYGLKTAPLVRLIDDYAKQRRDQLPELDVDEFYRRAPQETRQRWDELDAADPALEQILIDSSIERVRLAFSSWAAEPTCLSPYLPFHYDMQLIGAFEKHLRKAAERALGAGGDNSLPELFGRDNWLLRELINVSLPGLASLSPDDIVAIRQGDAFEDWRSQMRQALQSAASLPPDLLGRDKELNIVIQETLGPSKKGLEEAFNRSAFLIKLHSAPATLVCGAIGALTGYLVDPNFGALVGAASTTAAEVLAKVIAGGVSDVKRGNRQAQAATLSHYVALLQ